MPSKTITGADLKVYVNGQLLGTVTAIKWRIHTDHQPRSGLDQQVVQEFVPGMTTVQGDVSVLRVHGDGGLEGSGIVQFADTILLEKYVQIDLLDRVSDKVVFSAINAVVTDQSWSAGVKQVIQGNFTFMATDYVNEART